MKPRPLHALVKQSLAVQRGWVCASGAGNSHNDAENGPITRTAMQHLQLLDLVWVNQEEQDQGSGGVALEEEKEVQHVNIEDGREEARTKR